MKSKSDIYEDIKRLEEEKQNLDKKMVEYSESRKKVTNKEEVEKMVLEHFALMKQSGKLEGKIEYAKSLVD